MVENLNFNNEINFEKQQVLKALKVSSRERKVKSPGVKLGDPYLEFYLRFCKKKTRRKHMRIFS